MKLLDTLTSDAEDILPANYIAEPRATLAALIARLEHKLPGLADGDLPEPPEPVEGEQPGVTPAAPAAPAAPAGGTAAAEASPIVSEPAAPVAPVAPVEAEPTVADLQAELAARDRQIAALQGNALPAPAAPSVQSQADALHRAP